MRILMVSIYPPVRDGIAQYAIQEVRALRAAGHHVEVCSPEPSAAHFHLDLSAKRGPYALAKLVGRYDKVIIQWHPAIFYNVPVTPAERRRVALGLLIAFRRAKSVDVRVHEFDVVGAHGAGLASTLTRWMWRSTDRITVHTSTEQHDFSAAYEIAESKIEVIDHGVNFTRRCSATRAEAREELGLPHDSYIFLSIGFLQAHKGFDRAVCAYRGLDPRRATLEIVGSLRVDDPEYVWYVDGLRDLVTATPGATLHEQYVTDNAFDLWLVACDSVVLPYRMIWSSGVGARAELYGRQLIATRVGGLEQQVPEGTVLVDDDEELAIAMRVACGQSEAPNVEWANLAEANQSTIQAEIIRRAASSGSANRIGVARLPAEMRRHVPLLELPATASTRATATLLKRIVRKLTGWELNPIVDRVNELAAAVALARPTVQDQSEAAPSSTPDPEELPG